MDEASIDDLKKQCLTHAIGFIEEFRTHTLAAPTASDPFVLDPPEIRQSDPFWVVAAGKEVVDGHGGIWQAPFLAFLAAVILQHVNMSRSDGAEAHVAPASHDSPGPRPTSLTKSVKAKIVSAKGQQGNLADFARAIDPPTAADARTTPGC